MKARYVVGIDLGTTNCAVGYVDFHETSPGAMVLKTFDIPQLIGKALVAPRLILPSFLYLPGEYDLEKGATALPWDPDRAYVVGTFAQEQGALVPGRLVASAKSWLCHGGVDREAPILPWGAGSEVPKVSPITASSHYLRHIREAWDHAMSTPLSEQLVVLTVPASFDEVARELTVRAAAEAGFGDITLIEEPLAAFYAWLAQHETNWQEFILPQDLLLICDVGGGTTDFTLIAADTTEEVPRLERLAVGDHLLLGGDNMDLALADLAEKALGKELDPARWQSLCHQCRSAKEYLLSEGGPETAAVRLAGRGRSLIGGTLTTQLSQEQVRQTLLEGFFPNVPFTEGQTLALRETGLREMGLPYVSEPAVTRHLARFLARQGNQRLPSLVLFNGGTLKTTMIQHRLLETLSGWAGASVRALESQSLDLAISRGAAYYGLVRQGLGLRVSGGMARAYFVGVNIEGPKGRQRDQRPETDQAVCLVERGAEEGQEVEVAQTFGVRTNRPVRFSLYCSSTRRGDRVGDVISVNDDDFVKLPPVETVLRYGKKGREETIPVRLGAQVTAIGTLELYCESHKSPHRWRLQFQLRGTAPTQAASEGHVEGVRVALSKEAAATEASLSEDDRRALEEARAAFSFCFGPGRDETLLDPAELPRRLAEIMGMEKELWSVPMLRGLAEALLDVALGRRRSPQHEARWYNLAGFCLRPGSGEALDPWRIKKIWPLSFKGLAFPREPQPCLQWWIFWRRVAAGLSRGQQEQILTRIAPVLLPSAPGKRRKSKVKPPRVSPEERREMWLTVASLERLEVERKVELGRALLRVLLKGNPWPRGLWALSRFGARQPFSGPADKVMPPGEAWAWLEKLRRQEWPYPKTVMTAAVHIARLTGDRTRDLPAAARQEVIGWLQLLGATEAQLAPVREVIPLAESERSQVFGESLPEGLVFTRETSE